MLYSVCVVVSLHSLMHELDRRVLNRKVVVLVTLELALLNLVARELVLDYYVLDRVCYEWTSSKESGNLVS